MREENKEDCPASKEFLGWLADVVTKKDASSAVLELAKDSRHLFGNPKAARKTAWEDVPHIRDEL